MCVCVFCFQREKRSGRKRKEDLLVSPGGLSQGGRISQPTCCPRRRGCNQSGKWSGTVRSHPLPPSLPPPDVSSNSYFPASIFRLSRILLFAPFLSVSAPSVSRDERTTFFRCQSTLQSIRAPHKVRGTFHPPKRRQRLCGDKTDHWMIAAFPPTLVQSGKGHSPDIYALK